MSKSNSWGFIVKSLALCALSSGASHAALIDRGGGLIYDDATHLTWLQDASYATSSGYATGGPLTWNDAVSFAKDLEYTDKVRGVTWSDWRLPTAASPSSKGFDPTGASSELGYMYYVNLGLTPIHADGSKGPIKNDWFINLSGQYFWTSTVVKPDRSARSFLFANGLLDQNGVGNRFGVWLVRDGDVGAPPKGVPEPTTLALLGVGLLGAALARRRRPA